MFKYFFFIFFFINNFISTNNPLNLLLNSLNQISDNEEYDIFRSIFNYILGDDNSFMSDLILSEKCKNQLENSFFLYNKSISVGSYPYYKKLFFHSSKSKNDLSSFSACMNEKFGYIGENDINFTYITVLIDDKKSLYDISTANEGISFFIIGLCFIDNCEIDDYQRIIKKAMVYLNLTKEINNSNETDSKKKNSLEIKVYKTDDNLKTKDFIKYLELLPFLIMFIHLFFIIFNSIPIFLYKLIIFIFCCKKNNITPKQKTKKLKNSLLSYKILNKKKNKNGQKGNNSSSLSIPETKDNILKSFELIYKINNNFTSLIELKKQNEITNDGGLSYINGLKGISMIFLLFGSVYSILYSSLVIERNSELFYSHLNNIFFSIFYIGIKYAPKILLCTSGFSLFFKFICFLDGKADNEKDLYLQNDDNFMSGKETKDIKNSSSSGIFSSDFQKLKKKEKEKFDNSRFISKNYLFYFFGLQIHKYIIYILFLCFSLFSLEWTVSNFGNYGPMWKFFYQSSINPSKDIKYLIPLIIGFKSFFIPVITPEKENILHYFYLIFQEIIYFLITSIIIFIGYKKNLRIDLFFKIIFLIIIIFRILYYFLNIGLDDKDYFGYNTFGQFYNSMIYDYSFYIIGIHFGMINYVIQKGYSIKDCNKQKKKYLVSSLNLLNPTKKKNKKLLITISIISSILLIINIFLQQIIIYIIRFFKSKDLQKNMELYKRDFFSQIIMLFDSDIFVLSINALSLSMYLKGGNLINDILCHSLWSVFNRFYFSYILLMNPIILYILYNIESKIVFNIYNCILYSFICGIIVYFITIIIYITFELPFKKTIRFWLKLSEEGVIKERISKIEATYSYKNNLLDSATPSITDYNDDDGEDDEDEY